MKFLLYSNGIVKCSADNATETPRHDGLRFAVSTQLLTVKTAASTFLFPCCLLILYKSD